MKRVGVLFLFLTPLIYTSPLFQALPLVFRGYLPAAAIFVSFRSGRKWGAILALATALMMDALAAEAIGPYVLLHGLFLSACFLWERLIPYSTPASVGVASGISAACFELIFFVCMTLLGWGASTVDTITFFIVPLSTGIYAGVFQYFLMNPTSNYRIFGKDENA
ncbi:MAG: hypothetical protein SOW18_03305 [Peptoniphilus sp.]|nr:hypothetical protein [Peptoniphilus sp.]MDY3118544.1 hypothetical protein [Peptoniphilus sp.]